jgi:hypothetical protein
MPRIHRWGLVAGVMLAGLAVAGAAAATDKRPPQCAAIAFHPVSSGLTDGEHEAGLYKSHFGRIEVVAEVKGGEAQNYFVEFSGKPPKPAKDPLPQSVADCVKQKQLTTPTHAAVPCMGDSFTVLIDHTGEQRYILLYGRSGKTWHFCSAGTG